MPAKTVPEHRRTRYLRDERLRQLGYDDYIAYIQSPRWKATRARFYDANPAVTCICGAADRLILHHKTYERVGAERLDDLVAVCPDCHGLIHALEARGDNGLDIDAIIDAARAESTRKRRGQESARRDAEQAAFDAKEQAERERELQSKRAHLESLTYEERVDRVARAAKRYRIAISRQLWFLERLNQQNREPMRSRTLAKLENEVYGL